MLVNNWKTIILRAWSVRLIVLAGVFSALPVFFSLVDANTLGVSPLVFAALSSLASAGAFIARLLAQPGVEDNG